MSEPPPNLDALRLDRSDLEPGPATPRRRWLWLALLLLVGATIAVAVRHGRPIEVRTAVVREAAAAGRVALNASGYVVARREATVSSKVTGKVVEVLIEEGMRVEAGQVLARLDASNLEANLELAQAQLAATQSTLAETRVRLAEAGREHARVATLARTQVASAADLDRADAEVQSLEARLERQSAEVAVAERQSAVWRQQIEDTTIRAPFAGIATAKNAQPGEMISPVSAGGGFTRTGIGTIVDMNSLEVEVDVNESYLNRVQAGQRVEATLDAYPEWKIPCKVIAIIPTADRQKATVKVRIGFDALDPRILPQMGVKVAFLADAASLPAAGAVLIPRGAVQRVDGRDGVWRVRDGQAQRCEVQVTRTTGEDAIATGGLTVGEVVVLEPPARLVPGARVSVARP